MYDVSLAQSPYIAASPPTPITFCASDPYQRSCKISLVQMLQRLQHSQCAICIISIGHDTKERQLAEHSHQALVVVARRCTKSQIPAVLNIHLFLLARTSKPSGSTAW